MKLNQVKPNIDNFFENSSIEELNKMLDKYDKQIDGPKQCPPKMGGCPMMFYCLKPGEKHTCPTCGKICQALNISL